MPLRYDKGELQKPVREANGWMRVDAYLTRTGVFEYQQRDGTTRREYRPPDEVFKADSLKSFTAVPLTNDHPPVQLDAQNTKDYQVGHLVGAPVQDGNKMKASILVTDAATVSAMELGKREISNGYFCDVEEAPGVSPDGERYDGIQRNIVGNHVALVDMGRAGPEIAARMDRFDASTGFDVAFTSLPIRRESAEVNTMKFVIDGVEIEVSAEAAQLIQKERATHSDAHKKLKDEADKAAARADGLALDLEKAKKAAAEAPAQARADVQARLKLEATAKSVLGPDFKVDGVDSKDIRKAVAATEAGSINLDEKSEAYIEVLFDKAAQKVDELSELARVLDKTKPIAQGSVGGASAGETFYEAAHARFMNAGAAHEAPPRVIKYAKSN